MTSLYQIWSDIRKGENIDLYLTVAIAVSLTILNVVGIAPQSLMAPLTMTILALLAISSLGNRHKFEQVLEQLGQSAQGIFTEEFPIKLKDDLTKSNVTLIIGMTLRHTVSSNYALFEKKLQKGEKLHFLIMSPDGLACKLAYSRVYRPMDEESYRESINTTLATLCELRKIAPAGIEIKTIDQPFTFGFFALDLNTSKGKIYLEHYSIKMPADIPKITLQAKDGVWYEFFKEQASILWEKGETWPCLDKKTNVA